MSLITSCPACGTMFRVVPDQLKISEGWVRCGHCSEVFDATAHLSDESVLEPVADAPATRSPPLASPPPGPEPEPPAPAPRAWTPDPVTVPADLPTRPAELYSRPAARPPARSDANGSSDPSDFFLDEVEDEHPGLEPSPLDAPFVFRPSEIALPARESQADPFSDALPDPLPGRESQMLPDEFEAHLTRQEMEDVSFVRDARRKAFWRRPMVRVLLALSSVALAALLVLQLAYQDRDRLALAEPALRPALERMCELMQCTLGAPRQIESIAIESSGFNRVRSDTYRLAFTLRNSAPVDVAVPAMELTVTDAQDQAIARRVLTPAEFGGDGAVIPAAGEWSRTVGVVLGTSSTTRVAGYRLLAFYP